MLSPNAFFISYRERAAVVDPFWLLALRKAAAPILDTEGGGVPLIVDGVGEGRHSFLQRGESNVTVLAKKRMATSWYCIQGILSTRG